MEGQNVKHAAKSRFDVIPYIYFNLSLLH
jgi:hypothetical protein